MRPRPEMPRPFIVDSPAAIAWQKDLQAWVNEKGAAEVAERVAGLVLPAERQEPRCSPRSTYEWRPMPAQAQRSCHDCGMPTGSGASRCQRCKNKRNRKPAGYYAQKSKEYRERVRNAVREVREERDKRRTP